MSEENVPVEAESTFNSFEDAAASALEEFQAAQSAQDEQADPESTEQPATEQPADTPSMEESVATEAVPEHLQWAKSVQGLVDEDGNLIPDKLAEQYYQLNRGFQQNAQELSQYRQLFQDPRVQAALNQHQAPQPEAPKADEPMDESERILNDFVQERLNKALAPIQQRLQASNFAVEQATQRVIQTDVQQVQDALGTDAEGKPIFAPGTDLYQRTFTELGNKLQQAGFGNPNAAKDAIYAIAQSGQLAPTIRQIARDLAYDTVRSTNEQLTAAQRKQQAVQSRKEAARLPSSGSGNPVRDDPEVNSFQDAARIALREHGFDTEV